MFTEQVQSRAEKRAATHQKVLETAEQLFREQGFAATTIRQIAADAGVSIGTVMAVGDKDALLIAIFDGWIAEIHRDRDADQMAGEGPLTREAAIPVAMKLFKPFMAYFARDPQLSREYAAVIVRGDHRSAIFENLALALISEIEQLLSRSGLTSSDASRAARVIYFSYIGIVMSPGNAGFVGQSAVKQLRDVIRFAIAGTDGVPD